AEELASENAGQAADFKRGAEVAAQEPDGPPTIRSEFHFRGSAAIIGCHRGLRVFAHVVANSGREVSPSNDSRVLRRLRCWSFRRAFFFGGSVEFIQVRLG